MVLVQRDENIKYLNASLVSKLKDYNIEIPSFTIPDVLTQQGFRNAMKTVPFNDNGWIENTLNCLNIGIASCRGCNTRQTNYGQCSAGCFGANTCGACVGACNGGDAVCVACHGATDSEEVYVCESCNTGCEGCDADCYGCNKVCQGAQTCTSCNGGLPVPCEYTAGCTDCQGDYEHTNPTFGCTECVHACVAPDSCSAAQAPKVDGCISGNDYTESDGCTSGNDECELVFSLFDGGKCTGGFTWKTKGDNKTCPSNFSDKWSKCASNFNKDNSGASCESKHSQTYTDGTTSCKTNYSYSTDNGVFCQSGFSKSGESGESECGSGFSKGYENGQTCISKYKDETYTCQTRFNLDNNGSNSCDTGFSSSNESCPLGYTSTDSGKTCILKYSDGSTTCPSDYGLPTCSGCNATRNDQCLVCVASQDTCTACVNGEAASCTACVEAQGCSDCQGCDSGCNANVSCAGYSVGDNGQNVCLGQYTNTNCGQTCTGGFDSSSMCLSGQGGCSSCDSGCQGCNGCQGKVGAGCTSCDGGGCQTCDGCFGYTPPCTPCVGSFACDPCYGNVGGCSFGTKAGG